MATIHSSQEFIRALKASSDPPVAGGQTKIEIARQAWDNTTFYLPSKAEVIVDWLLSSLLKQKSQTTPAAPLFNSNYWSLLLDIFSDKSSTNTRPLKTWLTPLLHRTPLQPILSVFLTKFREAGAPAELTTAVASCVAITWPISAQKMTLENLADLFGLLLQKADEGELVSGIVAIGTLVTSSYRSSLGNSVNKKKFYLLFLQSYFLRWLRVLSKPAPASPLDQARFYQTLYDSGTDTLFNLDMLRQLSESHSTDQSTTLFGHLRKARSSSSSPESQAGLSILPRVFVSYVQAVKRFRGAVFSQSSTVSGAAALNDEVNAASMRFFASCEAVLVGGDVERRRGEGEGVAVRDLEVWNARFKLLECVFDEKLFSIQQEDASMVLGAIIEDAIGILSFSWQGGYDNLVSAAVKCLHKIGSIDCDLLLPSLPRIFPFLLPISSMDSASSSFLDLILDYHTKTRTLNTHVQNLLTAFTPTSFPSPSTKDIHQVYELCFSGHIPSNWHLEKLGNAVRRFLTPGQTMKFVESVLGTLKSTWQVFLDVAEGKNVQEKSPKKTKKREDEDAMAVDSNSGHTQKHDVASLAVSFSLQAYLVLLVLSNLPMQNLTEESATSVRCLVSNFRENIVQKALEKLLKMKRLSPDNGKKRRRASLAAVGDGWEMQIVATAMLRVDYALRVTKGSNAVGAQRGMDNVVEQTKEVIAKEGGKGRLIAELELEIFRKLLYHISIHDLQQDEALQVFDSILSYLSDAFKSYNTAWSGLPCMLKTPGLGALAVLHLVLERWLPFLDQLASHSQLTSIVQLTLSINLESVQTTMDRSLCPEYLLLRLLHSAEFWEMQNLRTAFLSHLVQITSTSGSEVQGSELAAYRLLLYVPAEYFTKAARTHFVRRAYTTDTELVKGFREKGGQKQKLALRTLVTLRIFLTRMIKLVGFERVSDVDLGDFVVHLISFDCDVEGPEHDVFIQSTLDLTGICFSKLLKNINSHSNTLLKVITSFNQYPVFVSSNEDSAQRLQPRIIANLVNEVTQLKDSASLPADCVKSLRGFHAQVSKTLSQQLQNINPAQLTHYPEALVGWCCILGLRRWLGENKPDADGDLGKRMVSIAVQLFQSDGRLDNIRASILAILRAELTLLVELGARQRQLDLVVATFTVFYGTSADAARKEMDNHISAISKALTPGDYSHTLDLISESLTSGPLEVAKLETVLHLAILFLRSHPQHTLKHMQAFSTQCLDTFSGNQIFTSGDVALRSITLEFIVQHCSERPATLRSIDIGSIFLILFRLLQPSEDHDERTASEIFHKIVASISALVRLRRDLVIPVLPHLGLILRGLLSLIRSCRPQLGSKQTAMVMRTLPRWITAKQPLGSEEGRTLSRLLETLNVKTVIRSHTAGEAQKAESLAKPFSKHAAYVLAAYIEALNDPLCILGMEMRRELEPGLFTLCEIMGEHARDALVVTLDTSGKAVLKLIWKEYEKQRYVGKG